MVYYFTSNIVDPPATIYVGKDKLESLFPRPFLATPFDHTKLTATNRRRADQVWLGLRRLVTQLAHAHPIHLRLRVHPRFHADNLSSAHIYLRLAPEQTWDQLPAQLVEECAQLTKANSIEGNKKENVTVIYTPWSNLHKNAGMATGQVGFHDNKKTRKTLVPTRLNATINRLEKTRTIGAADELQAAKEAHLSTQRAEKRREAERKKKGEEKVMRERREEKERKERGYEELDDEELKRSNEEGWDEDDFM